MKNILWPALTFVLSILSSSIFGRSLWCDEILRVFGQRNYSIPDLFAYKHLHDFCTQTPTGYLFMRPFQKLLGYEFGGDLVAALSAVVITICVLWLLRRFNNGKPVGYLTSAIVASNPLLIFFGSELSFYCMYAAAFAAAFALLFAMDDATTFASMCRRRIGFLAAGSLFVTFHFAGMFVWAGLALVVVLDRWAKRGFQDAFFRGILMGVPMLINLPMYLGAEGKAIHLGSQHVLWSRAAGLPAQLCQYVAELLPTLTGAWVLGVAVFVFGLVLLFREKATRQIALFSAGGTFAIFIFLAYSGLHDYIPIVPRYWLYALTPVLFVVGFAVEWLVTHIRMAGLIIAGIFVVLNALNDYVYVIADGRFIPYRKMVRIVNENNAPGNAVIFANHYDIRFFGNYYTFKEGITTIFPSYWEQGDEARSLGLKAINTLSPLSPLYITGESFLQLAQKSGWTTQNQIHHRRTVLMPILTALHLMPQSENNPNAGETLLIPQIDELVAHAEETGKPVFVPGKEWTLRQMPPQEQTKPFTPFLMLPAKAEGVLRVYVPKNFAADKLTLSGMVGSTKPGVATFGGRSVAYGKGMARAVMPISPVKKGEWNEIPVKAGETFAAFMLPAIN